MKTVNAFVDKENYTTFTCPHCQKTHRIPVAAQKGLNHKILSACSCQNRFEVNLNCRQFYRKQVNLVGEVQNLTIESEDSHSMVVVDLSMGGLRFKVTDQKGIKIGHRLQVRFTLDDKQENEIEKEARVVNINGDCYGCEFLKIAYQEKELGYYLFAS